MEAARASSPVAVTASTGIRITRADMTLRKGLARDGFVTHRPRVDQISTGEVEGVSPEVCGAQMLRMFVHVSAPNERTKPHFHTCEKGLYVVWGSGVVIGGPRLDQVLQFSAGDFIYVPAREPHVQVIGEEGAELVIVRADADDWTEYKVERQ